MKKGEFACELCNEKFMQPQHMYRHMKDQHGIDSVKEKRKEKKKEKRASATI